MKDNDDGMCVECGLPIDRRDGVTLPCTKVGCKHLKAQEVYRDYCPKCGLIGEDVASRCERSDCCMRVPPYRPITY